MSNSDDTIDPYRSDITASDLADQVVNALLQDHDAVRRYGAIQELQGGRLRDVAALSLRQLRDEHGTTEAAAKAVGVSRQAVAELLGKAGAPGARDDRRTKHSPAYGYGAWLAVARACASSLRSETAREEALSQLYDLTEKASATLALIPKVTATVQGTWLPSIRANGRPNHADALAKQLDDAYVQFGEWVANRATDPQLTPKEQSEVWLGYHGERARRRNAT